MSYMVQKIDSMARPLSKKSPRGVAGYEAQGQDGHWGKRILPEHTPAESSKEAAGGTRASLIADAGQPVAEFLAARRPAQNITEDSEYEVTRVGAVQSEVFLAAKEFGLDDDRWQPTAKGTHMVEEAGGVRIASQIPVIPPCHEFLGRGRLR
jgi:hypothetical protein